MTHTDPRDVESNEVLIRHISIEGRVSHRTFQMGRGAVLRYEDIRALEGEYGRDYHGNRSCYHQARQTQHEDGPGIEPRMQRVSKF